MREPLFAIEALSLETAITKHFGNLGVDLTIITEDKFSLVVLVFVLSTSAILSALESVMPEVRQRASLGALITNLSLVLANRSFRSARSS